MCSASSLLPFDLSSSPNLGADRLTGVLVTCSKGNPLFLCDGQVVLMPSPTGKGGWGGLSSCESSRSCSPVIGDAPYSLSFAFIVDVVRVHRSYCSNGIFWIKSTSGILFLSASCFNSWNKFLFYWRETGFFKTNRCRNRKVSLGLQISVTVE